MCAYLCASKTDHVDPPSLDKEQRRREEKEQRRKEEQRRREEQRKRERAEKKGSHHAQQCVLGGPKRTKTLSPELSFWPVGLRSDK